MKSDFRVSLISVNTFFEKKSQNSSCNKVGKFKDGTVTVPLERYRHHHRSEACFCTAKITARYKFSKVVQKN